VVIHSRLARSLPIFFLPVSRDGDDDGVVEALFAQGPRDLIAIEKGQTNVQEDDLGTVRTGDLDALAAVAGDFDLVTQNPEQPPKAGRHVPVVIHDQNPWLHIGLDLFWPHA